MSSKNIRVAVSALITSGEELYIIRRQNFLRAFPGYHAFVGGKVDEEDFEKRKRPAIFNGIEPSHTEALIRELEEEIGLNLIEWIDQGLVNSVTLVGEKTTPEFSPIRFDTYFYQVELKQKPEFTLDHNEVSEGVWRTPKEHWEEFKKGNMLMVPPTQKAIVSLKDRGMKPQSIDFTLPYIEGEEVPFIQPLYDIIQCLPLSNTFPPANRTNAFIIGDNPRKFLIDPSPKDEAELAKFEKTIGKFEIDAIFLTHHHPDHHQFATTLAKKYQWDIYLSEDSLQRIEKRWWQDYFEGIKTIIAKDSEVITQWNGENVLVMSVPGHDEGQLALYPESKKWFLASDLIQSVGTVVIGGDEGDMAKYFLTLEKVIAMNPNYVIPSHGITMGGVHKLKTTLEHRIMREEQVKQLLRENAGLEKMVEVIYPNLREGLIPYARKSLEAHIKKIQSEKN